MCFSDLLPYKQLYPLKYEFLKSRSFCLSVFGWTIGMLFICILIMSLMILKCSNSAAETLSSPTVNNREDNSAHIPAKGLARNAHSHMMTTDFTRPKLSPLKPPKHAPMAIVNEHIQQQPILVANSNTAYLLERTDMQPIYGTWRTKTTPLTRSSSVAGVRNQAGNGVEPENYYMALNKRMPYKINYNDQIPRPPHIPQGYRNMPNRRQFEANGSVEQPRPFNFLLEGKNPSKFKSVALLRGQQEPNRVNNIDDILKQLHINANNNNYNQKPIYAPTGLHITGTFKNIKASGIANLFRSRHKKQLHLSPVGTQPIANPSYQNIGIDPFYSFKPNSPNEINLLAIHQQLANNRSKNKKKRKIRPQILFQYGNHSPFTDAYNTFPQQLNAFTYNNSKSDIQRNPFSLSLDIYPVGGDYKGSPFTIDEAKVPTAMHASAAARAKNQFKQHYPFPPGPETISTMPHAWQFDNPFYNSNHFPQMGYNRFSQPSDFLSNSYKPDKYTPEPVSHQQFSGGHVPYTHINENVDPSSNQIMVHLNVFPKQKSTSSPYEIVQAKDIHDRSYQEQEQEGTITQKDSILNQTNTLIDSPFNLKTSRSLDEASEFRTHIDFEHPIVAEDPSNIESISDNSTQLGSGLYETARINKLDNSTNFDDLIAEAQTSSLFRFPVENLLQFQVNDAL